MAHYANSMRVEKDVQKREMYEKSARLKVVFLACRLLMSCYTGCNLLLLCLFNCRNVFHLLRVDGHVLSEGDYLKVEGIEKTWRIKQEFIVR